MSIRTILIHVHDVSDEVLDQCFFSNIIDFGNLFTEQVT